MISDSVMQQCQRLAAYCRLSVSNGWGKDHVLSRHRITYLAMVYLNMTRTYLFIYYILSIYVYIYLLSTCYFLKCHCMQRSHHLVILAILFHGVCLFHGIQLFC